MAILNFPNEHPGGGPLQVGDTYNGDNGVVYTYDGVKWVGRTSITIGYTGSKGDPGGNANIGNFTFTSSQVSVSNDSDITLVTNANTWTFGADGTLTLPSGNTRIGNVFGEDGMVGNTGTGVGVGSQGQGGYAALQWIDNPEDATYVAAIVVNSPIASTSGTVQIATGLVGGPTAENVWEFGADGNLTLPTGGSIYGQNFIGNEGTNVRADQTTGEVYINTYGGGPSSTVWTFSTSGQLTAPGHIIPDANLTYDLGSTSSQWRSIYVGTGTIYIGGVALGVNADKFVTVDGNPIITVNTTGNLTVQGNTNIVLGAVLISDIAPAATTPGSQWFNTLDGRTYIAYNGQWIDASPTIVPQPSTYLGNIAIDGSTININDNTLTISNTGTLLVNGSEVTGSGTGSSTHIEYTDGQSQYTSTVDLGYNFEVDTQYAHLDLNGVGTWEIGSNAFNTKIFSTDDPGNEPKVIVVRAGLDDWTFGPLGWFTLPGGSIISENMGGIRLTPANASGEGQALLIYPTVQDGNHIHLTSGGGDTDLYLGNDDQYVKVDHSGTVVVGTYSTTTTSTWTFGTDGNLTFPDSTVQTTAYTGGGSALGDRLTSGTYSVILSDGLLYSTSSLVVSTVGTGTTLNVGWVDSYVNGTRAAGVLANGPFSDTGNLYLYTGNFDGPFTDNIWTFGADGILTLSTASTILGNSSDPNVYIETSTTATTSTWTFGTNGILTLPAATPVIKGGGTGTDVTVIATTGTNTATWVFGASGAVTFPDATVQTTAYTGSTSTLVNGTYTVALSTTGQLNLPGAANTESGNARIQSANSIDVLSNLSKWTFGTDGGLTLPNGGTLRMSTAPTSSIGSTGDKAGTIAVNTASIFYCVADYFLDTGTYSVLTTDSNNGSIFFIEVAKGSYLQPQIGWGVSIGGTITQIDGATTDLGTSWRISVDAVTAYSTGTSVTLTNPSPSQANIWVKQAWGTTGSW